MCRKASDELRALNPEEIIEGVDVTDVRRLEVVAPRSMAREVSDAGFALDVVVNNAGYFYEPVEKVTDGTMAFDEEMKMIDICAVGPLRVTTALYREGKIAKGSKVAMVTSQGGWWRGERSRTRRAVITVTTCPKPRRTWDLSSWRKS